MRILFLTQVLPYPLDAGPKTRADYVMRALAQQHAVTLVSFVRNTDKPAAVEHLRQFCQAVRTVPISRSRIKDVAFLAESLVTNQPFIITRDRSAAMKQALADLWRSAGPFDAVHADQLWMAPYVDYVRSLAGANAPLAVLDQHNAVYMIFERLAQSEPNPLKQQLALLEARKLARDEAEVCARFDRVVWVTQEDYDAVTLVAPQGRPVVNSGVIPICVDPTAEPPIVRSAAGRRVTFLGGLHYPPNAQGVVWFAQAIFPLALEKAPDARLTAIGKQPPRELSELGIPAANLDVTGYVDDPRPYLQETAAFIVPLLAGGGMRVKILDAWSWGLPMVSTTVGAEGIAVQSGENLLVVDTPADFAAAVVQLLCDPALNQQLGENGRAWVEQHYNWRTVYRAWEAVYQRKQSV